MLGRIHHGYILSSRIYFRDNPALLFTVCETTYQRFIVEENVPQCAVVREERCGRDIGSGCVLVPRMKCEFMANNVTKTIPKTDVSIVNSLPVKNIV